MNGEKSKALLVWREIVNVISEEHPVMVFLAKYGAFFVALSGLLGSVYYAIAIFMLF